MMDPHSGSGDYFRGMANGGRFVLAQVSGEEPEYLEDDQKSAADPEPNDTLPELVGFEQIYDSDNDGVYGETYALQLWNGCIVRTMVDNNITPSTIFVPDVMIVARSDGNSYLGALKDPVKKKVAEDPAGRDQREKFSNFLLADKDRAYGYFVGLKEAIGKYSLRDDTDVAIIASKVMLDFFDIDMEGIMNGEKHQHEEAIANNHGDWKDKTPRKKFADYLAADNERAFGYYCQLATEIHNSSRLSQSQANEAAKRTMNAFFDIEMNPVLESMDAPVEDKIDEI